MSERTRIRARTKIFPPISPTLSSYHALQQLLRILSSRCKLLPTNNAPKARRCSHTALHSLGLPLSFSLRSSLSPLSSVTLAFPCHVCLFTRLDTFQVRQPCIGVSHSHMEAEASQMGSSYPSRQSSPSHPEGKPFLLIQAGVV